MPVEGQAPFRASHNDIFNMYPWIELRSLCLQESTFLCPLDLIVFRVSFPMASSIAQVINSSGIICFQVGTTGGTFYFTCIRWILSCSGTKTSRNLLKVQIYNLQVQDNSLPWIKPGRRNPSDRLSISPFLRH